MEQPAYRSTKTSESPPRSGDRLIALHEILFSVNLACAFGYASLVYISKNLGSWTPVNDSTYYFHRSAFRINDLLHLPSANSVSTNAVAREFPSRWGQVGDEVLILVTVLSFAALLLMLLRLIAGTSSYHAVLNRFAGATALLAAPACYLCVSRLTWKWASGPLSVPYYSFWRSLPSIVFATDILCLGALFAIYRKRAIPAWALSTLLSLHYAFWVVVLWPQIGVSIYRLYAPYLLLLAFPLSGVAWLLFLRIPHLYTAETGRRGRASKWTLATAVVAIAAPLFIWFPRNAKSIARANDMESLTIQMSRGPCRGRCPSYTITMHGNGKFEYVGERYVKVPGIQTGTLSREQVTDVLKSLERASFLTLEDRAFSWCFDAGSVAVSVSVEGITKRVVSDDSCTGSKSGMQAQFVKSAAEIDTIVGSDRWVSCDRSCSE